LKVSLTALLAVVLLGCAESLPEPPDLAERLAPYEEGPTTDVPLQEVVDTILEYLERTGLAGSLAGIKIIVGEVNDAIGLPEALPPDVDPGTNPREALQILEGRFFVDLIADVTHICEGHDPEAETPDADINGTLEGSTRITESGFQGVFWGEFDTCRFREESIDLGFEFNTIILDGPAAVWFLDPLGFDVERDYLFVFDGLAIFNNVLVLDGRFDFLFQQAVGTFVRVPTQDGGQVFLFQPIDNPNALELRTLTETWTCDLSAQQCASTDGTQVFW
jgi:hypothetical protein